MVILKGLLNWAKLPDNPVQQTTIYPWSSNILFWDLHSVQEIQTCSFQSWWEQAVTKEDSIRIMTMHLTLVQLLRAVLKMNLLAPPAATKTRPGLRMGNCRWHQLKWNASSSVVIELDTLKPDHQHHYRRQVHHALTQLPKEDTIITEDDRQLHDHKAPLQGAAWTSISMVKSERVWDSI